VSAAPGKPVLEIRDVTKAFGEREVLRGIDLTVREHEAVALIGASGSGKSTLLRCIDLLEEIDDGDVFLDGEVITDPAVAPVAVRRRLGLVFQAYNLFPHMTALENVVLGERRAHGASRAEAEERGRALLARFGLEASSSGSRSPARLPVAPAPCSSTRSPAPSTPSSSARSCRPSATSRGRG
jgi:polar amino acid transport system ATP-binding protein